MTFPWKNSLYYDSCSFLIGEKGSGWRQFNGPDGIAISPITGQVYIIDSHNHCIQVLNPDLTFSRSFGKKGSANGQFNEPGDVAIDSQGGLVYVTDYCNYCIQKFTPNGKFLAQFGSKGSGPGKLDNPSGIRHCMYWTTGLVYVSEAGNYRVSVFTSDGVFLSSFGREGNYINEFWFPMEIIFDKNGFLYVCDFGNNQLVILVIIIQIFEYHFTSVEYVFIY